MDIPFDTYDFFGYVAPGMLVVAGLEWTLGYPHVLGAELKIFAAAVLVLAVFVAGHLVAGPARALLETWFARRVLGPPSLNLIAPPRNVRHAARLFPLYFEPLPANVRARIVERAASEGCAETGEPLFLHVRFHEKTLANERLMGKLDRFVGTYGFARNMSFACLGVALAVCVKVLVVGAAPSDRVRACLLLGAGVLLVYRFLKFYRQYTYELFNNYGSYRGGAQ